MTFLFLVTIGTPALQTYIVWKIYTYLRVYTYINTMDVEYLKNTCLI